MATDVEKVNFKKLFRDLRRHITAGQKLHQSSRTDTDARFLELFNSLDTLLSSVEGDQEKIARGAPGFDFIKADGSHVCGNGYRSLLFLLLSLLSPLLLVLQKRSKESGGKFFRPADHLYAITDYCRALQGMSVLFRNAVLVMESNSTSDLFASESATSQLQRQAVTEYTCRDVFYGKLLGFQYDSTLKPVLKSVALGMASYENWFLSDRGEPVKQLLQSLWDGSKYLRNPDQLGLKLDYLTQETSIHFVKAFWSLLEQDTIKGAMKVISPRVDVSQWLEVPSQDVVLEGGTGPVTIKPPSAFTGYKPIPLLLISNLHKGGQKKGISTRAATLPPARGLVIHMHGGGFVAQSPKSHEYYLRTWSRLLDTPIVSIDYSLAPEAVFPRALDECVLAYGWILNNLDQIGSTGERIVLAGDSAGGQLAITVAMKLKQLGLRLPDRILSAYPGLNYSSSVSPSRIVSLTDPLLPLGVMISIQQAVTGNVPSPEELQTRRDHRRKILKSQGINLPLPASSTGAPSSPAMVFKKFTRRRKGGKEAGEDGGDQEAGSPSSSPHRSRTKSAPPPRPPPPSSGTPLATLKPSKTPPPEEAATLPITSEEQDSPLQDIDLAASLEHQQQQEVGVVEEEKQRDPPSLPLTTEHLPEPAGEDKLSTEEFEKLVTEVLVGYKDKDTTKDPFLSPLFAPAELLTGLPPINIVAAGLDSLLDDSVEMAKKLQSLGQPVTLDIIERVPHAFLCLMSAGKCADLERGQKVCIEHCKEGLKV